MGTGLTRTFASAALRASLEVPDDWREGELSTLTGHREQLVAGPDGSGVLIQHMEAADPDADVRRWATAPIELAGVPGVSLALATGALPELLEWAEAGDVAERTGADEATVYSGRTGDGNEVHVLVARWGPYAWQVGVAAPDESVAGAIFASLQLG